MSGSLSALQMLPGHPGGGGGVTDSDDLDPRSGLPVVHTGKLRAEGVGGWTSGETTAGHRVGTASSSTQAMSFAVPKGQTPLAASKTTLGSLLFAVEEERAAPTIPDAAGTTYPRER